MNVSMNHYTKKEQNITTYNYDDDGCNANLIKTIRKQLGSIIPQEKIYGLVISSIHCNEDICFNSHARELLYAINDCFYNKGNFRENKLGKSLSIPVTYAIDGADYSKFELYFRYYFKKRIDLLYEYLLKNKWRDNYLLKKKKEEAFCNYEIVFYIDKLPMDIKQYIRNYLVCSYNTLVELRNIYEKARFGIRI